MKKKSADFDTPWKSMLEKYFQLWLEFLFPAVAREINWEKPPVHLDKELLVIQKKSNMGKKIADKLIQVFKTNGDAMWIILHVEIQGGHEKHFAERLFQYYYRIYDRYKIPVVTLAILTDHSRHWRPCEYIHDMLGCQLKFKFPIVKLIDFISKKEILYASKNPIAKIIEAHLAVLVSRNNVYLKFENKLRLVKNLYTIGYTGEKILDLYDFIDHLISLPDSFESKFIAEMHQYEERMNMPYVNSARRIGREEGREEGSRKMFLLVLNKHFALTNIPPNVTKRVEKATEQELEQWLCRILDHKFSLTELES